MSSTLGAFDPQDFWEQSDYALQKYVDAPPTKEEVAAVEKQLGYKLPPAYVELAQHQNGGIPKKRNHRTKERTTWSHDHIAISGIYSIGQKKLYSLCGRCSTQFWLDEWGYPAIGVYFANCPSAGHDMLCLDYRKCGPTGEPQVVHIDQERDYTITFVAENFATFIRGLEGDKAFQELA